MKKIYTLLFILTIATSCLLAQTLQLKTLSGTVIPNGGTVVLKWAMGGDTTTDVFLELKQKNISTGTQSFKAMKAIRNLPDSQKAYYCFAGGCFSDTTIISPTTLILAAGQEDNNFSCHIRPNMHSGSSKVYYKFFNTSDANDTIGIYIQTEIWHLGINDLTDAQSELGTGYPNPASEKFTVPYSLKHGEQSYMVIQNVLGSAVREETLSGQNGKIQFNIEGLPEGVYLYSLYVNGKIFSTKKLLVRH
ncbi:MAG: T9SS type A sorting domain-containing protein [Bacteroidota bacterium]